MAGGFESAFGGDDLLLSFGKSLCAGLAQVRDERGGDGDGVERGASERGDAVAFRSGPVGGRGGSGEGFEVLACGGELVGAGGEFEEAALEVADAVNDAGFEQAALMVHGGDGGGEERDGLLALACLHEVVGFLRELIEAFLQGFGLFTEGAEAGGDGGELVFGPAEAGFEFAAFEVGVGEFDQCDGAGCGCCGDEQDGDERECRRERHDDDAFGATHVSDSVRGIWNAESLAADEELHSRKVSCSPQFPADSRQPRAVGLRTVKRREATRRQGNFPEWRLTNGWVGGEWRRFHGRELWLGEAI